MLGVSDKSDGRPEATIFSSSNIVRLTGVGCRAATRLSLPPSLSIMSLLILRRRSRLVSCTGNRYHRRCVPLLFYRSMTRSLNGLEQQGKKNPRRSHIGECQDSQRSSETGRLGSAPFPTIMKQKKRHNTPVAEGSEHEIGDERQPLKSALSVAVAPSSARQFR